MAAPVAGGLYHLRLRRLVASMRTCYANLLVVTISASAIIPSGLGSECCSYQWVTFPVTRRKYDRSCAVMRGRDSWGVLSVIQYMQFSRIVKFWKHGISTPVSFRLMVSFSCSRRCSTEPRWPIAFGSTLRGSTLRSTHYPMTPGLMLRVKSQG